MPEDEKPKRAPAKKKTSSAPAPKKKANSPEPKEKPFQVYDAPGMQSHPMRPPRDLVKVLIRNPLEAYVFWELTEDTFRSVLQDFGNPEKHLVHLKLKVSHLEPSGKEVEDWYEIHPLSNSYYCKFTSPARSVRAEIFATYQGKLRLFLEARGGDLPPRSETLELDPHWIHPEWIAQGLVRQDPVSGSWSWTTEHLSQDPAKRQETPFGSSFPTSPGSSWGTR